MDPIAALDLLRPRGIANALPSAAELPLPRNISDKDLVALRPAATTTPEIRSEAVGTSFADTLGRMVDEVSYRQQASRETVAGLLGGQNVPLHQAMISMEEASVSFQLMVEVRNRLLESYQELMRMQI